MVAPLVSLRNLRNGLYRWANTLDIVEAFTVGDDKKRATGVVQANYNVPVARINPSRRARLGILLPTIQCAVNLLRGSV